MWCAEWVALVVTIGHPTIGKRGATAHHYVISPNADEPSSPQEPIELFSLGRIVATRGAIAEIPSEEIQAALRRHHTGDWGDLDEHDKSMNQQGLTHSDRLVSVYHSLGGVKFYIITEHDRSVTTVLLPEEY